MNSVISFPNRGNYGKSSYRGNCSGYVQMELFKQFRSKIVTDPMAGSFTTKDVCDEMGIKSHCYDLSQGFNALRDDIPEEACESDTWFWHPPYSSIIGIPYAGKEWDDKAFIKKYGYDPKPYDLGQMDWLKFINALNHCLVKFYSAMETGARMCILMGDIKRKGRLYSMLKDIAVVGTLENIVIKMQHNCVSDRRTYSNNNFIPIVHEYIMILKKEAPFILDYAVQEYKKLDSRDAKHLGTWRDVVADAIRSCGRKAKLEQIYALIEGHDKANSNPHWKEKVRQTLQINKMFVSNERGIWALAS